MKRAYGSLDRPQRPKVVRFYNSIEGHGSKSRRLYSLYAQ